MVGIADGANWAMATNSVERSPENTEDEDEKDNIPHSKRTQAMLVTVTFPPLAGYIDIRAKAKRRRTNMSKFDQVNTALEADRVAVINLFPIGRFERFGRAMVYEKESTDGQYREYLANRSNKKEPRVAPLRVKRNRFCR